jgi:hypothetical protein
MTLERETMDAEALARSMQAWVPWSSYAWLEPTFRLDVQNPATLRALRRAHALSPLDALIADVFARHLIASGDRAAARGVAADLRRGGLALHELGTYLISAHVDTSEARFGAALSSMLDASEISRSDVGWTRVQRFDAAWSALELAVLLGRARTVADLLVTRFIAPEQTVLDSNFPSVPLRVAGICMLASDPDSCFARFRELRPQLAGAITRDTDDFLAGAESYAKQDYAGAARAWRPLAGGRLVLASVLPDAMADAFERAGSLDLAERVDQEIMKRSEELHGATLAHARAARRALARGERAKARELAEKVIAAWSIADEEPPELAAMHRLIAQLEVP